MVGWGIICLVFGIGTFVLPMFEMEFRILSVFGDKQPIVAVILIIVGVGLLVGGLVQGQSRGGGGEEQ